MCVLKKKTISMACVSCGTELTTLAARHSELGSLTGEEVFASFPSRPSVLGMLCCEDVLTVGLRLTALLFDEQHQYFSSVS